MAKHNSDLTKVAKSSALSKEQREAQRKLQRKLIAQQFEANEGVQKIKDLEEREFISYLFRNSSAVRLMGWEETSNVLRVIWRSGTGYDYANISEDLFRQIVQAESVGNSITTQITHNSNTYPYKRLPAIAAQDFLAGATSEAVNDELLVKVNK